VRRREIGGFDGGYDVGVLGPVSKEKLNSLI
jgi:hypothetical protein